MTFLCAQCICVLLCLAYRGLMTGEDWMAAVLPVLCSVRIKLLSHSNAKQTRTAVLVKVKVKVKEIGVKMN